MGTDFKSVSKGSRVKIAIQSDSGLFVCFRNIAVPFRIDDKARTHMPAYENEWHGCTSFICNLLL